MLDETISEGEGGGVADVAFHDAVVVSFVVEEVSFQSARLSEGAFAAGNDARMAGVFGPNSPFKTGCDAFSAGAVF